MILAARPTLAEVPLADLSFVRTPKGGLIEEHHLLPDADIFKSFWTRPDIDIDIEDFKIAIDVVTHRGADVGLHPDWNKDWRAFIARNPSRKEVFDFAKEMVTRYAID